MSDATLSVLFVANACAIAGLLVLVVRGVRKTDYSRYVPPNVVDGRGDVRRDGRRDERRDEGGDGRRDVDVPAPRVSLDELPVRQAHAVSPD
ncbi:MAG TPA: hypothetical protein VNU26_13300 [Mycobacteriales bacterium]|nr:hypothetical protein [Mycobacteriales bacterium]